MTVVAIVTQEYQLLFDPFISKEVINIDVHKVVHKPLVNCILHSTDKLDVVLNRTWHHKGDPR